MGEAFPSRPSPLDNHRFENGLVSPSLKHTYPASPSQGVLHVQQAGGHLRSSSKGSVNGSDARGAAPEGGDLPATNGVDSFHDDRTSRRELTRRSDEAYPYLPPMSTASPSTTAAVIPPTAAHTPSAAADSPASSRAAPPAPLSLHMHSHSQGQEQGGSYVASPTQPTYPHHQQSANQAWMEAPRSAPYYGYSSQSHPPQPSPRHHPLGYSSEGGAAAKDERANGHSSRDSAASSSGPDAPRINAVADEPPDGAENGVGDFPSSGYAHLPRSHSVPAEYGHGQHLQHHHASHPSFSHYPPAYMHPQYMQQFHYPPPPGQEHGTPPTTTQSAQAQQRYAYVPYGFPPATLAMSMAPQNVGLYYAAPHSQHASQQHQGGVDAYSMQHPGHGHGGVGHDGAGGRPDGEHAVYPGGFPGARGESSSASSSNAIAPGEVDPSAAHRASAVDPKQPKLTKSGKPRLPRQLISCDFCRMRKLRCDGQRPCGHCARRSRECVYQESVRKRGKGKKSKDKDDGRPDDASYDASTGSINQQDIAGGTLMTSTPSSSMPNLAASTDSAGRPGGEMEGRQHDGPPGAARYWDSGRSSEGNAEWTGHEGQGRWTGGEAEHASGGYDAPSQTLPPFPSTSYQEGHHQL